MFCLLISEYGSNLSLPFLSVPPEHSFECRLVQETYEQDYLTLAHRLVVWIHAVPYLIRHLALSLDPITSICRSPLGAIFE